MADQTSLNFLANRDTFLKAYKQKMLPKLDFSGTRIEFDFSNLTLGAYSFENCDLRGAKFCNSVLGEDCNFQYSNWDQCDFTGAHFNGCKLGHVRNAHKAIGLDTIRANSYYMNFETAERPWWNYYFDWERINVVGRLPFFGASSAALVILPIYFYLLDLYNQHIVAWTSALAKHMPEEAWARIANDALNRLGTLTIPKYSLEMLISSVFLFFASSLFAFVCPPRIKQFSSEEWRNQLKHPIITYWVPAWEHVWLRMLCAFFYAVGGLLAGWIILIKLIDTAEYIWRNT